MRRLQLEYGAEIGRAVVNFDGPIVFCVISRFHGGAFVVFSRALNDGLETLALEGAHASVIGGAPAAAVVFAREVDVRTRRDPRIAELDERIAAADGGERQRLRGEREARWAEVRSEKLGELAAEFDAIHSVERAVEVGSVDRIVPAAQLRPALIEAVERGMAAAAASAWPRRRAAAGRAAAARSAGSSTPNVRAFSSSASSSTRARAARPFAVRWIAWMRRSASLRRRSARPSRSRSSSTPTIGLLSIRSRRPSARWDIGPSASITTSTDACLLRIPCGRDRALEALRRVLGDERQQVAGPVRQRGREPGGDGGGGRHGHRPYRTENVLKRDDLSVILVGAVVPAQDR